MILLARHCVGTRIARRILCVSVLIHLVACAPLFRAPLETAQQVAAEGGLVFERIHTQTFTIATFHKGLAESPELLVAYIEGDGHAWLTKHRISPDPTPRDPVGLRLAVRESRGSVLYVARPCQYPEAQNGDDCDPKYWSSHRFSEEVVESVNRVLDWAVKKSGARALGIVGYSGGGALATLLASRRTDVRWLITVAGNLDHRKWTALHEVSPLVGSLNALDVADKLPATLPQLHLSGERDTVMPPEIADSFFDHLPHGHAATHVIVPEFDHQCCWARDWRRFRSRYPLSANP